METDTVKCEACENLTAHLNDTREETFLEELIGWERFTEGVHKIGRSFRFRDFKEAMVFVNRIADLAETNGHHPDLHISYNRVQVVLYTHAVKGLSENDFIMARQIDRLLSGDDQKPL